MKIRGYSSPQSLPISAAPGTAGRDEVPKQRETGGGADELGQLLNEPSTPDSDQHFPGTLPPPAITEQSLTVTATTVSLSSKISSTAVNLTKASAASAPQARDSQSAATPTSQPHALPSCQNTVAASFREHAAGSPEENLFTPLFSSKPVARANWDQTIIARATIGSVFAGAAPTECSSRSRARVLRSTEYCLRQPASKTDV